MTNHMKPPTHCVRYSAHTETTIYSLTTQFRLNKIIAINPIYAPPSQKVVVSTKRETFFFKPGHPIYSSIHHASDLRVLGPKPDPIHALPCFSRACPLLCTLLDILYITFSV